VKTDIDLTVTYPHPIERVWAGGWPGLLGRRLAGYLDEADPARPHATPDQTKQ
jgi:hypothetical protein